MMFHSDPSWVPCCGMSPCSARPCPPLPCRLLRERPARGGEGRDLGANVAVACIVGVIRELGLRAPIKSEAIFIPNGIGGAPPRASVVMRRLHPGETQLEVSGSHLGRWGFVDHFNKIVPRLGRRVDALLGLVSNLRDPGDGVKRAYMHAVLSRAYYGAPIWSKEDMVSRRIRQNLCKGGWSCELQESTEPWHMMPWRSSRGFLRMNT